MLNCNRWRAKKKRYFVPMIYFQKQSPDTCEECRWLAACRLGYKRTTPTAAPQLASSRTNMPSPTLQSVGYRGINTRHDLVRLRNRERRIIYLRRAWRNNRDYPRCSRDQRENPYWLHPRMLRFQSVQKRNFTYQFPSLRIFAHLLELFVKRIDLFYENKIADTSMRTITLKR